MLFLIKLRRVPCPWQRYLPADRTTIASWTLCLSPADSNLCPRCSSSRWSFDKSRSFSLSSSSRRKSVYLFLDNHFLKINLSKSDNQFLSDLVKRSFHASRSLYEDSSKVETTVKALREAQKKDKEKDKDKLAPSAVPPSDQIVSTPQEVAAPQESTAVEVKEPPKRSLGKRIWDELVHYYHGFRLLVIDIRITSRLVWKILNGEDLTRREHKQLIRTTSDVFRLVPFSVFIIVPFMEFLLPVFLKLFPNMLPSTFQTSSDRESKFKKQLKLKIEMAKFLQNTLDQMTLKAKGESHSHTAKEFAQFFEKIRKSGKQATNEEIMKFSKLFEDEITLDSLTRPQLVALCRLLELQPIGTNNFLRFQLRMQLRSLKADDQMIHKEGIDSLTVPELQQACRARGMRALGLSEDRLKSQLSQWLELSLNENIPQSLLLLSRVLYLPENIPATEQIAATIQSLPEEVATEAKYKIGETEGKIDNRTKIELLKKEEAAIKREIEEERVAKEKLSKAKEETTVESVEELIDKSEVLIDKAVDFEKSAKEIKQDEEEAEKETLSKEDIDSLEDALENISKEKKKLLVEKGELQELKEEMKEYKEDIEEFKELTIQTGNKKLKETKAAKRLRNKVDKMIDKMDNLLENLDSKKQTLQQKIDIKSKEDKDIQKEKGDVISINDLILAIRRIKKVGDDTKLQRIENVLDTMDIDHDGQVEIEHVVKVIELLGRENVKVTPNQMKDIINLLIIEEKLEEAEKKSKQEKEMDKEPASEKKSVDEANNESKS